MDSDVGLPKRHKMTLLDKKETEENMKWFNEQFKKKLARDMEDYLDY